MIIHEIAAMADNSNWMSKLPTTLQVVPISAIAIPGSHDSGTYSLDPNGPFAPDQPNNLLIFLKAFGCLARPIVYRWSVTQTLTFTQQLQTGIRYLDLRISRGPASDQFSIVHGLYGAEIRDCLTEVKAFSQQHPQEVIILDINHLYAMNLFDHQQLVDIIVDALGPLLIPCSQSLDKITLNGIWQGRERIFCFYHSNIAQCFPKFIWPACAISCPWPNVTERSQLITYLDQRYACGPPPAQIFYGTQGILTPTVATILRYPFKSLKEFTGENTATAVLQWVNTKKSDNWFNIIILDFVELDNFTQNVILLNYQKLETMTISSRFLDFKQDQKNLEKKATSSPP
ncbi:PI-PLC X domain-containing protein 3-like [Paramacrobiotus metropolitanus]|uniref:PI-PLC X domain-containing protein 3-like n=1 Tax=Paramacrobiotus metropolitanus TaxID=2943436 RepID=UPI0024456AC8|nr:PI-PLC X domain-containing protein 3-like [Paramacrobiotus metropolitanus]